MPEHTEETMALWRTIFGDLGLNEDYLSYFEVEDMLKNPTLAKDAIEYAREALSYVYLDLMLSYRVHVKKETVDRDVIHRAHEYRYYYNLGKEEKLG